MKRKVKTGKLYSAIVQQARQPEFYQSGMVPDTVEGRYEMVVLHCYLVLRRLNAAGRMGAMLAQDLFDYMGSDFDRSMREIGVGDVSVGKYMKRLGMGFYGRAAAYDAALAQKGNSEMTASLARNVLGSSEEELIRLAGAAERLASYVRESDDRLQRCSVEDISDARPAFANFAMMQAA